MKTTLTQEVIWRLATVHISPSLPHHHVADELSKVGLKSLSKVIDKHFNVSRSTTLNAFNKMAELTSKQYYVGLGKLVAAREQSLKSGDILQADDSVIEIIIALAFGIMSGKLPETPPTGIEEDLQAALDGSAVSKSLEEAIGSKEILKFHSSLETVIDSFISRTTAVYLNYYTKEDVIMAIWLIALDGRFKLQPVIIIPTAFKRPVDLTPLGLKMYRYLSV